MPLISVIVPVYNTEKFLRRCIDSILAQTFTDFELLLIDDGSKDNSGAICDEYAAKDSRIRVFHKENGGVSSARSLGLGNAKGEWVTFVDSDDNLRKNALEIYAQLFAINTDIIIEQVNVNKKDIVSRYAIKDYREGLLNGDIRSEAWGKMIRHSLFVSSVLDIPRDIRMGEDMLMHIRLSFLTEKEVCVLPCRTYNYCEHEGQVSKSFQRSLDYEEFFHKYLKKSIPDYAWNEMLKASIKSRLNALRLVMMNYSMIYGLKDHKFYIELCNDINKAEYPLSWRDRLFLKAHSNLLRILLVTVVNIYTKLKWNSYLMLVTLIMPKL